MAHFFDDMLLRPERFNFARDVVDYWASRAPQLRAMRWVSQDAAQVRELTFSHFARQSVGVACLLRELGIRRGDVVILILPRIPAWLVLPLPPCPLVA